MPGPPSHLTISDLANRSGAARSALRFYEDLGLITAERTTGNQRRYPRHMLRRVAFIRAGRQLGLSLAEIRSALDRLPSGKAPTRADWSRAARTWQHTIDARIAELEQMSSALGGCIGCGCLSLRRCAIYNPNDTAAALGQGARWLLGDESPGPDDAADDHAEPRPTDDPAGDGSRAGARCHGARNGWYCARCGPATKTTSWPTAAARMYAGT